MVGILPTLRPEHVTLASVSENPRYSLLDQQIFAARGEDLEIVIDGVERLHMISDTIMPEAACTSTQVHLQVSPDDFAGVLERGPGHRRDPGRGRARTRRTCSGGSWSPSRGSRCSSRATDTRSDELKAQGVRPRVWFGERWITSIFDLFEENSLYFPALLPISTDEDPIAVLDAGGVPKLEELRLHNGTVYRWNRPVYDISDGKPHLRVENRVLPAGPTVVDTMANAAFFAGLVRCPGRRGPPDLDPDVVPGRERQLHGRGPARHRRRGVLAAGRPGAGHRAGGAEAVADGGRRVCGCGVFPTPRPAGCSTSIEQRCLRAANGATWQTAEVSRREAAGRLADEALRGMLASYLELMHSNEPVHSWETADESRCTDQSAAAIGVTPPPAPSTIVVGYSPKPEGRAALQRAITEATLRGSSLIVVHTSPEIELDELTAELGGVGGAVRDPGHLGQPRPRRGADRRRRPPAMPSSS